MNQISIVGFFWYVLSLKPENPKIEITAWLMLHARNFFKQISLFSRNVFTIDFAEIYTALYLKNITKKLQNKFVICMEKYVRLREVPKYAALIMWSLEFVVISRCTLFACGTWQKISIGEQLLNQYYVCSDNWGQDATPVVRVIYILHT